jgi:hypothetical protein
VKLDVFYEINHVSSVLGFKIPSQKQDCDCQSTNIYPENPNSKPTSLIPFISGANMVASFNIVVLCLFKDSSILGMYSQPSPQVS